MGVEDRYKKKREEEEKSKTLYNGVENRYLYKNAKTIGKEITNRVNTWLTNNNNYISNAQNRFSGSNTSYRSDASDWLTTVNTQRENFQKEAESIKSVLNQYKDFFGEDYVKSVYEALDGNLKVQDSVIDAANQDIEYWSQWASEDEYNDYRMGWLNPDAETNSETVALRKEKYQANVERIEQIERLIGGNLIERVWNNLTVHYVDPTLKDRLYEEKEALKAENKQYEITQKVRDDYYVPVTGEFLANAAYRDYSNPTRDDSIAYMAAESEASLALNSGGYNDAEGNIYDNTGKLVKAANSAPYAEDKLGLYLSADEDDIGTAINDISSGIGDYANSWQGCIQQGFIKGWSYLTEYEINIYYDLYKREGQAAAYKFLDDMEPELNRRATQETIDHINNAGALEMAVLNISSIPMNIIGGPLAFLDDAGHILAGKDIDPYSDAHMFQNTASAIRDKTAADIDKATGGFSIPVIDFSVGDTYQALMSGADSLVGAAIGGTAYGVLMGMGSASSTARDLHAKGASTEQIIVASLLAGAAEMFFEKFSIDMLVKNSDAKTIKGIIVNMLKQGGVEATEEMATEIANTITNVAVMGSRSDWVDMGTFVKNVVNAGLGGFISGGGMGGIYSTAQKVAYDQRVKKYGQSIIDAGGVADLQASAANLSDNKAVAKLANKVAQKISAKNVGKLATTIQQVTDAKDRTAIVSELEGKGLSKKEAQKVADFVMKTAQGYEATASEVAEIEKITDKLPDGSEVSDTNAVTDTNGYGVEEYGKLLQSLDAEASPEAAKVQAPTNAEGAATAKAPTEAANVAKADAPDTNVGHKADVAAEVKPAAENAQNVTENATAKESPAEAKITASDEVAGAEEKTVTLEDASKKYGAQAGAMISTYTEGQDVAKYDAAYSAAYNMGKSGVALSYAMNSGATAYLTESQRELAHAAGADASSTTAKTQAEANKAKANGKTGRRKGTVKGEGVKIEDLRKAFNDTQGKAYKLLTTYAEATGIDIVLYNSAANADGKFEGAQGKFKWSEDTIYIDINAGLADIGSVDDLAKYTMLRTFSHEFTHFIEKWNPVWYNEFRKVVFDTLTERGENVEALIETKQAQNEGMTYDKASREVVAEAMTDILPDANFVEELANNHKTIFAKLLEKLKEFVADLKAYFSSLNQNSSREANALKEQIGESVKYVENIVKLFDKVAVEAVTNYQATVATEEADPHGLTDDEQGAILAYKSGGSYTLNTKLRENMELDEYEQQIVDNLDRALEKLPTYKGTVYRNIQFDGFGDKAARDAFVAGHVVDDLALYEAYSSTSTAMDGYVLEGDYVVHLVIESVSGRNMAGYGNNFESEVLLPRNSRFITNSIEYDKNGTPTIYLTEVANEQQAAETQTANRRGTERNVSRDHSGEQRSRTHTAEKSEVQPVQAQNTENGEVQSAVSGVDSDRGAHGEENLREVRTEVSTSIEESEKEYKKKCSPWLKRAGRRYVLHSNGVLFLSDGNFALRATEEMVGWARLEFSGTMEENALPKPVSDALENANILLTNAPLEGTLGDKTVYVFDLYGKTKAVFDKKYLSRLDGNLLYVGDYMKNYKILKAVDAEGNVVGFVLPVKVAGEITNTKPSKLKSFSNKKQSKQEVKPNVENVDNRSTVQQSDADRQGDSRVLDEVQTDDVQRDAQRGDSVGDAVERGQEAGRNGADADHGAGTGGRSGNGDRQSGDLRRNDELTPEAEKLHEEVTEQIAQQSTEQPKGRNFVIGDSLDLPNGEKARYKANIEAIKLVKQLEAENRYATEAEQVILSKYVGWGGLANAFDQRKTEWAKEYTELKELLTEEEYGLARGSTLNAHYTDISVIKAMYDGLAKLGFDGGRMLEPSSGVGNFVGAMPTEMSAKVKSWTMVELDSITGLIAKYLYPNADVRIQGFEKANIPDNYMDVIISNVPFGKYAIADKKYPNKVTDAIHNYFFAKSLDKVRPGGIVMFITSSYTMNAKDTAVRRYMMQRADLLGAIRLPSTAFKGNAGTEVVTDILVLKKRAANTPYAGQDFLEAPWTRLQNESYNGAYINSYFTNHPEMVLGTPTMDGGMYRGDSLTYKALEGRGSLADQIREAFSHIEGKMDYPATLSREKTNFAVERANKKTKENGLVVKDGKVYQNKGGELVEVDKAKGAAERITGMLEIRDLARNLMNYQQQGLNETEIKKARTALNKAYDAFVKKYGFINAQANRNAFIEDPDRYSLFALENWNPDTKQATKADIFSKNTIAPNRTVTTAKDVSEGLIVSVNQTGGVDTTLIARLTGKTEADVTRELIDSRKAFKNRNGDLEAAETYLSGNVRAKLRDAEALVPIDGDYANNVEALKAVMPADVGYQDIFVNPGTPWIPNSVYSDFAAYMLEGRNTEYRQVIDVTRNAETGNFTVELKEQYFKHRSANTQKWGTSRRTFLELFDAMLNSKSVVIKDKLDDGSFVINKDATAAANEKIENITKEFQEWLWRDEARRTELATLYNEVFNSVVTPKYNGDNLTVNGANALKPLRPHQRNAVQRVISSGGNTLLAHKVGAGKTYEMAAAAMKLKELGLVKKPMFAVPKSLVAQWGNEFIDFFPTAKLLVAEASDFAASNRKVFMNRIANGEYDAVIVSYEQFEKLPMSDDFTRQLYQEQIDSVIAAIEEAKADKGGKALSVKDLEKKRKSLQTKIDKLTDKAKDEGNIDFEQLGVDSLFVDEAHNFKNLFYTTSMTNVAGLGNKDGSKRAFDLYTKVRYLQQLNGGRGIVFATATPVMNSMSEMYIMQKYLQPDLLNQLGLNTFDAWAKQFGEVVNGVEIKPSGQGYRVKQSFSRFKNMSELQLLFRNFADVLTDIPGLKIPKMKGGKVNVVVCEPGQFQQDFMKELEQRADNIKNVDPSVDNMLKITSDGRKISYTQRMIDPSLPYEEGCKIYRCADNVIKEYNDSKANKGTQIIFCDMATPKGKSNNATETEDIETDMESAQLYDDLKTRLRQGGIPAKEIAFIHEADTDQKKKKLFADVNDGKVRVLIGSTGKMGVGMNAQKRIVAIHHLDAPWRPGDVEQRDGRAFRQGNINDEVSKYTYVTEGSFDARLWDILDRKQNFINPIMNGENMGRDAEDTGEVTLSAAEVKALASGSPLIMEQVQLDTDIKKLESLYRAHASAVFAAKERLSQDKGQIDTLEKQIANGEADMLATVDTYSEGRFSMTVGSNKYADKKDAGVALMAAAAAKANPDGYTKVGSFAGFELRVIKTSEGISGLLVGKQGYPFKTYPGNHAYMTNHIIGVVESVEEKVKVWRNTLAELQKDIAAQEKLIAEPFAKQAELDQKRARYIEVMDILNPKEEQSLDSVDEDTVQEQSREYLGDDQEQQRTTTLNDREVLALAADALEATELTDAERDALQIFRNRLTKLEDLQEERAEQGRLYKEQQFGTKVDREAAAQTLNRMHVLDDQIKAAKADVISLEDKKVLGDLLKKARKVVESEQRSHDAEILKRYRDRTKNAAAIKKYRDRITADVEELTKWALKPDNKDVVKHIPDVLKNSVIPFLSSIDFTSKQQLRGGEATKADTAFVERLKKLQSTLREDLSVDDLYSGYIDLPANFMSTLNDLVKSVEELAKANGGKFVINQMTSEELKDLSIIVRTLKTSIANINKFHANSMFAHVYEAGDSTISALSPMSSDNGKANAATNFVFWQQIRPAYAFERFGRGGLAIYDGLRRGQAQLAFNTQKIVAFTDKLYTDKEVNAWEKEVKEIKISAGTVKMRVSDMMSLYELSKQPDSLRHMLGEGMRVATYTVNGKKISDNGRPLNEGDVKIIVNELTQRQKDVADAMQKFMAEQGGAWGNEVSVKRFGEQMFTNEQYFPINSDGRHLQATADEHPSNASLYALLNMSFTKSRNEKANNRIIVYSIFDVFANHMASMAQYNAMALPVLDAIRWFNYQQKTEDSKGNRYVKNSVREQMTRVYGVTEETRPGAGKRGYAEDFVLGILKAFNGTEAQGIPSDTFGMNALRRYNMAQVAFNTRVVVQQPLAITRAALLIDYGSIMRGMKLKPAAIKQNIAEMQQYSGIAAWKSLGFYDVNISRGLTDTIKHNTTVGQKIGEIGMWGAEQADTLTWAAMWSACKEEVIKKEKITPHDADFYDSVAELFEEVIYKTQVVDSILTKNEFLRSKGLFARVTGSFMSEPTTTASMLIDAVDKYNADLKRGMSKQQAWAKNKHMIGRTMYVYAVSAVILAAVQAVADAWRDDDDYETFMEKWLEAFGGNVIDELMPVNKLPILSDVYDLVKEVLSSFGVDTYGNPPTSVYMQWWDSLVNGTKIIHQKITGEDTNYTYYAGIYKLLQAASGIAGLPMAAATREVIAIWNNTVGAMAPSLKLKSYDPGDMSEIKYAYADGYLTFDEAAAELLEKGLVENEDEAYFTISGWEAGDGYSRYDKVYEAAKTGGSITEAMNELVAHGYTEKDVISQLKSQIGRWYYDDKSDYRITKQQAIDMLTKYTDMTDEEITKKVNEWSSKVVTGIAYGDIGDEYMAGNITASRAIDMYMRYGGMSREDATNKVSVYTFIKDHPSLSEENISYSFVSAYTEYCEPQGIDVDVFHDVWQYMGNAESDKDKHGKVIPDSKKQKVLAYIETLGLSKKQMDGLYYALGYAESTIHDAPWH